MSLTKDQVTTALATLVQPSMIKNIRLSEDDVEVTIDLGGSPARAKIEGEITEALKAIGAASIRIVSDAAVNPAASVPPRSVLPQVKRIIAVGAGKGGVGKSTVAVSLAIGLQRRGYRVGLMDGDIYGPSMPTLLGLAGLQPSVVDIDGVRKIRPLLVHGIHAITIGALVEPEKPLMWRGPMAHGAFKQLLLDNTQWPELDYLIVDLPPGTGDVPITLCQLLQLTGAVIVATPQQVALDDAIRAARMFQQLGAPILGVVENMSVFVAPDGTEHDLFGKGGAIAAAGRLGLPILGSVPLFPELRINGDAGRPHANFEKPPALKVALEALVENLVAQLTLLESLPGVTLEVT